MTSRQINRAATGLLATFVLALAVGCASRTTAPQPKLEPGPGDYVSPEFLTLGPIPNLMPLAPGPGQTGRKLSITVPVDGAVGGCVSIGRFSVQVPAGAFDGVGDIKIEVPDSLELQCDLDISPGRLNPFLKPVLLHVDCAGASNLDDPSKLAIVRFDPAFNWWSEVDGNAPDVATIQVSAPLAHFSRYGVVQSKAGW